MFSEDRSLGVLGMIAVSSFEEGKHQEKYTLSGTQACPSKNGIVRKK